MQTVAVNRRKTKRHPPHQLHTVIDCRNLNICDPLCSFPPLAQISNWSESHGQEFGSRHAIRSRDQSPADQSKLADKVPDLALVPPFPQQ